MAALHERGIVELRGLLDRRECSAVELTTALLERIAVTDARVQAFLTVDPDGALAAAQLADQRLAAGEHTALLGIPLAIKDVLATAGLRTTCGSRQLAQFVPPYDASTVAALKRAGAILLGKTNCDEFAMGSSTENSAFAVTRNPWDLDRVPGGSSGGSAAAVAALQAPGSLGTDTGGSIRQPASLCGVSGLKPTYGRVSRYGLVAFGSSLDCVGPFARSVADLAALLQVLAGHDPCDGTSSPEPVPDYAAHLTGDVRGLRIGVPAEYFVEGIQPGVETTVRTAIQQLASAGAELLEVSLPHTRYALPVYYILAPAEASANLARYDGVRYGYRAEAEALLDQLELSRGQGFGAEVRRRIMLGTYALSAGYYDAYYRRAQQVRTLIRQDFERVFEQVDLLAMPTSPDVAFRIGERTDDPLAMYLADVCTLPISLAGLPGLVIPCGLSDGLPVGLQLVSRAFAEPLLLRVGDAYQRLNNWHTLTPQQL